MRRSLHYTVSWEVSFCSHKSIVTLVLQEAVTEIYQISPKRLI
jgi:hypothetical protein